MSEILEKIKSRGYWEVLIRPKNFKKERISELQECKNIIERNAVLFRGWDFPHFPRRRDKDTDLYPGNSFFEGWIDWSVHKEIWRIYQSGQFITHRALWEDWQEDDIFGAGARIEPLTRLGVRHTIYQITEFFEFLANLSKESLFPDGFNISIALNNTAQRELWLEDNLKVPFMYPRTTGANIIFYEKDYIEEEVIENSNDFAIETILFLFERFEWKPARELIRKDQENLLKRK